MKNLKLYFILSVMLLCGVSAFGQTDEADKTVDKLIAKYGQAEVELGQQNADEIAKNYKFVEEESYTSRVNAIGTRLASVANSTSFPADYGSSYLTPFNYQFKVIDSDDINAFSVMGGFIYINKGIIDFCQSDDELAGIIAHEVIHAAHHHLVHLIQEQSKTQLHALIAIAVGALASKGDGETIANLAMASSLYQIAILNGYSQQAESDSDSAAIDLMLKSGFNPVGMLTPMERLMQNPELVNLGIYRSHPLSSERVIAIKAKLRQLDIPIIRSSVLGKVDIKYDIEETEAGQVYSLKLSGEEILKVSTGDAEKDKARCDRIVKDFQTIMADELDLFDLKLNPGSVTVKKKTVFTVENEDTVLMGKSEKEIAQNVYKLLRKIVMDRKRQTLIG